MLWPTITLLTCAWQMDKSPAQKLAPVELPAMQSKQRSGRPKQRPAGKQKSGDKQKDSRHMNREDAQRWWGGLSEEERGQARDRMKRFREMSPEARRELQRRVELLHAVGEEVVVGMDAERRENFDALPREERGRIHQEMVRAALKKRGEDMGGGEDSLQKGGFEDRLRHTREKREERARKHHQRELGKAVEDGWLSKKAAEKLRAGSPENLSEALCQVRQWRMVEHFDAKGLWQKLEIDDAEQGRIKALPPREFLEELRKRSALLRDRDRRGGRSGSRKGEGSPERANGRRDDRF
ncbi:MAG: DUF3106 domain-containing protein [Planctomycetes bacterium]|nr:DUF3106 domain-containing protein [Planctomycetota bacterium]